MKTGPKVIGRELKVNAKTSRFKAGSKSKMMLIIINADDQFYFLRAYYVQGLTQEPTKWSSCISSCSFANSFLNIAATVIFLNANMIMLLTPS